MILFNSKYERRIAKSFNDPMNYLINLYRNDFLKFLYLIENRKPYKFLKSIGISNKETSDFLSKVKIEQRALKEFKIKKKIDIRKESERIFEENINSKDGLIPLGDVLRALQQRRDLGVTGLIKTVLKELGEDEEYDEFMEKSDSFKRNENFKKVQNKNLSNISNIDFGVF